MSGLRILLAQNTPDHGWTGMGRWAHETAEALRERGHQVTLWFSDAFPAAVTTGRAGVVRFPAALGRRIVAERSAVDVAVIHEPAGRWYARARRRDPSLPPMILMCHNVEAEAFAQLRAAARRGFATVPLGMRVRTPLFRLPQSRGAIRMADHVLCLSRRDREALVDGWRVPEDRVTSMVNGAPPTAADVPTPPGPPHVLFIGGWLDIKGRQVLPPLWAAVHTPHPDARLTLVGTGVDEATVRAAFPAAHRDSVDVVPRVREGTDIAQYYASHHLLVVPSISEGSPLVILEAMAAGLPIAAAAVGGIPDAVRDRREALLFPSCDPTAGAARVRHLLEDRPLARHLAEAAQRRARTFTWNAVARTVERIAVRLCT